MFCDCSFQRFAGSVGSTRRVTSRTCVAVSTEPWRTLEEDAKVIQLAGRDVNGGPPDATERLSSVLCTALNCTRSFYIAESRECRERRGAVVNFIPSVAGIQIYPDLQVH